MEDLVAIYFDINNFGEEDVYKIIRERLSLGAYKLLNNKGIEEIKKYTNEDFKELFDNLYSAQRKGVYNDLIDILNYNKTSGLSFFKGIVNMIIKSKHMDIEQVYRDKRKDIDFYSRDIGRKLKFGKGTISQIAHFCKPEKYPIYNTKSKEVISYIYKTNVIENNLIEFTHYADELVGKIKMQIENRFKDKELNEYVAKYKYVLLDDFVEFAYERILITIN